MSLGLTSFKHHPSMSEETMAFDATVTWEGRPICHARNDGRGGMTLLRPIAGSRPEDVAAARAANAVREPDYYELRPGEVTTGGRDLEDWVENLANREVDIATCQRAIKRCAKRGTTLAMREDGSVSEFNAPPSHPGIPAALEKAGATNLMTMPVRDAAALVIDRQYATEQARIKALLPNAHAPASARSMAPA